MKTLAAIFGVAAIGTAAVSHIAPTQFGLQEIMYSGITNGLVDPGMRLQIPLVHYTHTYKANTQKLTFNAGGCRFQPGCTSTADQNALRADLTLNYRILPNATNLNFHRWAMEDNLLTQDGYWLLTQLMNESANAVFGKKTMVAHLNDPQSFVKEFYADLIIRLEQNNVPVEIGSVEMHNINTSYVRSQINAYSAAGPALSTPSMIKK